MQRAGAPVHSFDDGGGPAAHPRVVPHITGRKPESMELAMTEHAVVIAGGGPTVLTDACVFRG